MRRRLLIAGLLLLILAPFILLGFVLYTPSGLALVAGQLWRLERFGVHITGVSGTLSGPLRVDGPDYRHPDLPPAPDPISAEELIERAEQIPGSTLDDFDELCAHLSTLHPSRYGKLIEGVSAVFLNGVHPAEDQSVALRLVVLADRLYDASIPVTVAGAKLDEIFTPEMLAGGYRKKYLRATSRLLALSRFEVAAS